MVNGIRVGRKAGATVAGADESTTASPPAPRRASGRAKKQRSGPARILIRYINECRGLFAGILSLRLIKDVLPFVGPILIGIIVDLLSGTDRTVFGYEFTAFDRRSVLIIAFAMAGLTVAKVVIGYAHTIASAYLGRTMVESARRDMAEATMQMTLDERRRFNSGDLLDRSLTDSKGLRSFVQNVVIRLIANTVRAVLPLYLMFKTDSIMAIVVLAVIPLQSGFSGLLQRRLHAQTRRARASEAAHTSAVKESIDGWSSVVSVGGQDWVTGELKQTASAAEDAKIAKKHTTAAISAVINICTNFGIAACYAIGGWRIIDAGIASGEEATATGALTIGALTTFIGVAKKTYAPFQAYTKIVSSYRTGLVNLERIAEVLDAPMQDPRPDGPMLQVTHGQVDLTNVSFRYAADADPVLSGLTGTIPGRSLTVITGPSGTGKTTLLRMLMGLDVPETGSISIDGQDINKARLSSVRSTMALVPQEPMLFTGTLGENLLFGNPEASTEDLVDACHKAGLLDLVRELPNGLDTEVGSGRHMLSGGQLRRMAIARALLRRPGVLLLDEPTTGLDKLRSEQVLDTLRTISAATTVIMVSHRRDPLAASDHHFILDNGTWSKGVAGHSPAAPTMDLTDSATGAHVSTAELAPGVFSQAPADNAPFEDLTLQANGTGTANGHVDNGAVSDGVVHANGHDANGAGFEHAGAAAALHLSNGHGNGSGPAPTIAFENANGTNGSGNPLTNHVAHHVLGLSAMGRPVALDAIDRRGATANVILVGGHRAGLGRVDDFSGRFLAAVAPAISIPVGVASIPNLNPDGEWTDDGRTVLGIDPVADHHRRASTETLMLHGLVQQFDASLILDVAQDAGREHSAADVEIAIRYRAGDAATSAWLLQLSADIERRLAASRYSFTVDMTVCAADSLTAALDVPVVEMTAIETPGVNQGERLSAALLEAGVAVYKAAGLSRPVLANA